VTDVVLYVELDELEEQQKAAFLAEADGAGFAVDELYGSLGAESTVETVLSTLLGSMIKKLVEDWGAAAAAKLASLLAPLLHRKDGKVAIEDRDTRITFVWDPAAKRDIKLATAAMLDVGGSLHLVTDGTAFRWDAATQRWYAARK
jgi:hypothetical protein